MSESVVKQLYSHFLDRKCDNKYWVINGTLWYTCCGPKGAIVSSLNGVINEYVTSTHD